eukprot:TRINITY_DN16132_c0_g1_i2.p1 TRINITY_DN16132_c0_g1~~TRINITY_DN16132_c0_g1_i2.p1  ORF type:complete len:106 (+),score=21.52 TRINITY_DN16132_c0_g1_i2:150-467(+)
MCIRDSKCTSSHHTLHDSSHIHYKVTGTFPYPTTMIGVRTIIIFLQYPSGWDGCKWWGVDDCSHGCAAVSYTHLRAHETPEHLVCRLLLEKKKKTTEHTNHLHLP